MKTTTSVTIPVSSHIDGTDEDPWIGWFAIESDPHVNWIVQHHELDETARKAAVRKLRLR